MGMVAAFIALYKKQYIVGMLILSYCQIQLSEAIIWRGIDTSNSTLNKYGTAYAKYTLPSHLFFVGIGVAIMTAKKDFIPLFVGILFYIYVMRFYSTKSSIKTYIKSGEENLSFPANKSCMTRECQNNENRLQWPFHDEWYILQMILIFIVFFIYLPNKTSLLLSCFFIITFIISKMMYKWSASSIWCFLSAVLAPILVIIL